MRGNEAYAVLGLRPGAGRDEVDQAYRRLIKRYHPDAAGGDAGRAAEINRAYSELRSRPRAAVRPPPPPPATPRHAPVHAQAYPAPRSRWRVPLIAAAAVAAIAVATSTTMTGNDPWAGLLTANGSDAVGERTSRSDSVDLGFEDPLAPGLIESSVGNARRLYETSDPALAAEFSRECLNRLSAKPSLPLFDSCAAYDEAIAILSAGNPTFEAGPFNPLAVTARQVGAARSLSANDFEAETRLQQIRSRVHMALLPGMPDSVRASAERVSTRVAPPRRMPVQRARPTQIRYRPETPAAASAPPIASQPRQVAPSVPRSQSARAVPPQPRAVKAESETKPEPMPAWQQPLKPAWQRPLPTPQR